MKIITTLNKIIEDLKIISINEDSYETFFTYIIEKLRKDSSYDFFTNNKEQLKNCIIFSNRYSRIIEVRTGLIENEYGRQFSFVKTKHFDDEIDKYILNKKIKKIKSC